MQTDDDFLLFLTWSALVVVLRFGGFDYFIDLFAPCWPVRGSCYLAHSSCLYSLDEEQAPCCRSGIGHCVASFCYGTDGGPVMFTRTVLFGP